MGHICVQIHEALSDKMIQMQQDKTQRQRNFVNVRIRHKKDMDICDYS